MLISMCVCGGGGGLSKNTCHLLPQRLLCEPSQRQMIGCHSQEQLYCNWLRKGGTSQMICRPWGPRLVLPGVPTSVLVSLWRLAEPGHRILETRLVSTEELTMQVRLHLNSDLLASASVSVTKGVRHHSWL